MDKQNKTQVSIAKVFAEGSRFSVTNPVEVDGERVVVRCTEGAFKGMLWHALRGLPKSEEGGSVNGTEAVEVKGFLLGTVELTETHRIVTIKEVVQLPLNEQDAGDAAYFDAKDRAILEGKLRSRHSLQMVGNYHSHPNHEIKLSEIDVTYLSQYLPESYHVAVVVGPRVPAIGFFLKDAEGKYEPWQEPEPLVGYERVEAKQGEGEEEEKKGFPWRPAIKQWVDPKTGEVKVDIRKKMNKKLLALYGVGAIVIIAAIIWFTRKPETAAMIFSPDTLKFDSMNSKTGQFVTLKLDKEGEFEFEFEVESQDFPKWLHVDSTKGSLTFDQSRSIEFKVDIKEIDFSKTVTHQFKIKGDPKEGGRGNSEWMTVIAKNDVPVQLVDEVWELGPIRVDNGYIAITLPDLPDIEKDITVVGKSGIKGNLKLRWTEEPENTGNFRVRADKFGSPLDWDQIEIEGKAVYDFWNPKPMILRYTRQGSRTLNKFSRNWDLEAPEKVGGKAILNTKRLRYPAKGRFFAYIGGKRVSSDFDQVAGQPSSHSWDFTSDLDRVGVNLAYVGEDGIYQLNYAYDFEDIDLDDVAFDESQGEKGQEFRRAYRDKYENAILKLFGEMNGPKHILDIPLEQRWGRLTILGGNKQVHKESWGTLIRIGDGIEGGQMAWDYNHADDTVRLHFVFRKDGNMRILCEAIKEEAVYKYIKESVEKSGIRVIFFADANYDAKRTVPVKNIFKECK